MHVDSGTQVPGDLRVLVAISIPIALSDVRVGDPDNFLLGRSEVAGRSGEGYRNWDT